MSHPIPATPPSAAPCSNRLELAPSRLAAALWCAWLILVCVVTLFGVAIAWPVRVGICGGVIGLGLRSIQSFVWLAGRRGVRVIEWSEDAEFMITMGSSSVRIPARLGSGSFRCGTRSWVLRFMTQPGPRVCLVVENPDDTRAFRRLSRCLDSSLRRSPGRSSRPAVTIPPKV
jgi:hypothetical protein